MTNPIDSCGACEVDDSPTPQQITNRPGLSAIHYRVGTYPAFRQAMLRAIHRQPALKSLTARRDDDFGIALFDMWAYILDILTFYQERIANEAFLGTATQPESLRRLIDLINYMPSPGRAASVYLAFLLQPPTPALPETTITPRLRVQSVPGPNEKPQKFETEESRLARAAWNQLAPVRFQPQAMTTSTTSLYLKGRQGNIKPGDRLLIVGQAGGVLSWDVRPLTDVTFPGTQTRAAWATPLAHNYTSFAAYILRRRAALFGANASLQPQTFTVTNTYTYGDTTHPTNVTSVAGTVNKTPATPIDWTFARPVSGQPLISLDAEYATLVAGDWLVLSQNAGDPQLYRVVSVTSEGYAAYGLSGKVTKVRLNNDINLDTFYGAHLRDTSVFFGAQPLDVDLMPVADPLLHGQTIAIEGDQSGLEAGRTLLVKGPISGTGEVAGETVAIATAAAASGQTVLTLSRPLTNSYPLASVTIYANVIYATHGETTGEVLGNGDAAQAFQRFTLKKAPVTYVPQAGAPNGAASTLQLRADNVLWQEAASFFGHGPQEAIYTARIEEGKHVVRGGDGQTGRRFPTGKNNVTASYRVGIGQAGNVKAGVLTTLLDRPAGVKQVLNPLGAEGGADPEPPEQVRSNAPNTVRTFGRIVSLRDFEAAARQYAGIAKARAEQTWNGEEQVVQLTVARDRGAPLAGGTLYDELLADVNSRRDPNRALELQDYTRRPVVVHAKLYIDAPTYLPEVVYSAALAAIGELFDFERLNLGQTVHLSDIMATLQRVPGVVAVDVDRFIFKCPPGLTASARRAFYQARRRLGAPPEATLGGDGCPTEGNDVQDFAGAFSNELITLEDPAADLLLTPIGGIKGTQL
jgi:predicted phage baseplate assembly protein